MCEDCFDEFDGDADRPLLTPWLISRMREIEAGLPGEPVPDEAWPVFLGAESGNLVWAHHERMARSREAAMVLGSLRSCGRPERGAEVAPAVHARMMEKARQVKTELDQLVESLRACRICRDAPLYGAPLPHEPRPVLQISHSARICIASQAPGARVHASGRPYTDPSGVRLRNWLDVEEDRFYDASKIAIIPMGFCFPGNDHAGGDLPPRRECQAIWHEQLFKLLPNIELMLVIGQYAQRWHLGRNDSAGGVTATVGRWRDIYQRGGRPRMLPLPHPSWRNTGWLKRNPWFETDLLPVLRADVASLLK